MSIKKIKNSKKKFNISENLRALRGFKNITVPELHKHIGIEINTLRKYETDKFPPSLSNLLKIANYFGISLDFLLLWTKTPYPRNIYFVSLANKIDSMDQVKRFQIESTANSLIGQRKENALETIFDNMYPKLTDNFNMNIKILRKDKNILQKQIADYIGINQRSFTVYEKKTIPPADKIIKIAEYLNISIHSLTTGKKLIFQFNSKQLLETILKADKLLSLEEIKFLIHLMHRIIEDSE